MNAPYVSLAASAPLSLRVLLFALWDISVKEMQQCASCVRLGSNVLIQHPPNHVPQDIIPTWDGFIVYPANEDTDAKRGQRQTALLKMFVLKAVGVMEELFFLAHLGHTIPLMVHNPRKPVRLVHWVIFVRTVAQWITHQTFVQQVIIVHWGRNFPTNFLALQGLTTLTSTSHQNHWHAYLVLLVVIAWLVPLSQPCVRLVTIAPMAQAQELNLLAMLDITMMNLVLKITQNARLVRLALIVQMAH